MEPSVDSLQKVRSPNDAGIQTVIGFDEDSRRLVGQLVGGRKQLQFISVVGMAGLGKTTLVKKIFDEPSVVYHFYVRAWTSVTQEPNKRDLILGILKSGFNAGNEDSNDMELSETLKRRLSGQRYLLVMDDIWDSKDWNDMMLCFPDDNVGSRIVFTTRLADVPLQVQPGCYQHHLRFLTEKESWDLLQYKVFHKESCPSSLIEIGLHIARKCHGLPLSIVVIAGILASDTTTNWWSQVAQDMNSIASNAPEQYMDTLVLSYNHLPDHLKPCFLYFAAFPEDYEIPAWKLVLLWVAEGFITYQTAENNLEDEGNMLEEVAAHYLKDLITRSLIIVSKSRSNGGIKSCIVHDALRDLCIRKAEEVNFLHQIPRYQQHVTKLNTPTKSMVKRVYSREVGAKNFIWDLIRYFNLETQSPSKVGRQSIHDTTSLDTCTEPPTVETILCCNGSQSFSKESYMGGYLFQALRAFKFLRVLDLSSIGLSNIPNIIGFLLELRYIALCITAVDNHNSLELPITNRLIYLETLIVHNRKKVGIDVPRETWMWLFNLRHLILKGKIIHLRFPDSPLHCLSNLQTLSIQIPLALYKDILECTPNLRKLGITAPLYLSFTKLSIPNLDKLQHLENLSLQNDLNPKYQLKDNLSHRELSGPSLFPATLKKLTLVCTFLKWDEMQIIGMLPILEVLKLQCEAFRGERWETTDGGFCRLKHLAFKFIKIVQWIAYSEHFPNLQHLKLDECKQLEEIPIGIGDIYTMEMIEIRNCNRAVVQSAHKIKEDQMNKGNDMLKISIFEA